MAHVTDAWVLHAGAEDETAGATRAVLRREPFAFDDLAPGEALVEPVLGSWEANIDHALARTPIDVCSTRREAAVVLGNFGLVRVVDAQPSDGASDRPPGLERPAEPGDLCLLLGFGPIDQRGYAELVYAYDAPSTMGLLAKKAKVPLRLLLPLPARTRHSHAQWATYCRYFTAWDNWRTALACWRSQVPDANPADCLVLGWGGGVSLAALTLARRFGFRAAMTASSDARLNWLAEQGLIPLDRRLFPALAEPAGDSATADYGRQHRRSLVDFSRQIEELSDGRGVAIMIDNLGQPLFKAARAVLGREGVIATCGWKAGMRLNYFRAAECIQRHIFVHTHVWRYQDSVAIRDDIEQTGWIAPEAAIAAYGFDDVPALAEAYAAGAVESYFPLYQVNVSPSDLPTTEIAQRGLI